MIVFAIDFADLRGCMMWEMKAVVDVSYEVAQLEHVTSQTGVQLHSLRGGVSGTTHY
jgi:hypothetical protein